MPLSPGPWEGNINGVEAWIELSVQSDGFVSGTMNLGPALNLSFMGLWDETSQKLAFVSEPGPNAPDDTQEYYEAYLITTPRNPPPGQDIEWTLAGSLQCVGRGAMQRHGSNARRTCFGWYAKAKQVA